MKNFDEMTSADFKLLGRSLNSVMSLGDIMMLPMMLPTKSDAEVQELVDKMNQNYLPQDYTPSMNRTLVRLAAMNAL